MMNNDKLMGTHASTYALSLHVFRIRKIVNITLFFLKKYRNDQTNSPKLKKSKFEK